MTNKIQRTMPEKISCFACSKYNEACPHCKLINTERLNAVKKRTSDLVYVIIYHNWNNYLEAVRKPFKPDATTIEKNMCETEFVRNAKRNITKDLYPFTPGSARFCRSIWNAAIKDLSHRLFGTCPIVKVKVGNKNKRMTLWY